MAGGLPGRVSSVSAVLRRLRSVTPARSGGECRIFRQGLRRRYPGRCDRYRRHTGAARRRPRFHPAQPRPPIRRPDHRLGAVPDGRPGLLRPGPRRLAAGPGADPGVRLLHRPVRPDPRHVPDPAALRRLGRRRPDRAAPRAAARTPAGPRRTGPAHGRAQARPARPARRLRRHRRAAPLPRTRKEPAPNGTGSFSRTPKVSDPGSAGTRHAAAACSSGPRPWASAAAPSAP